MSRQGGISSVISNSYKCFARLSNKVGEGSEEQNIGLVEIAKNYSDDSSGAWRNSGYATGNTTLGKGLITKTDIVGKKLSEVRLLFACTYNGTLGAGGAIISNAKGVTVPGLSIIATSGAAPFSGALYLNIVGDDLASVALATDSDGTVISDSTDHNIAVYVDGPSKSAYTFIDGKHEKQFLGSITKDTTFTSEWCLLMEHSLSSSTATSNANKVKNLHIFEFDSTPVNILDFVREIHRNPSIPCHVCPIPTKKELIIGCVGQSNEFTTSETSKRNKNDGRGTPMVNSFGSPNWWPSVAKTLGNNGYAPYIKTHAVGGSSLVISWCGQCRTWESGIEILRGSYVLSDSAIWKSTNTSSITATDAPTGTSNITTSDGIAWTYLGTPSAEDVDRHVYDSSSSRFDPNGYIANVKNHATSISGVESLVYISIGQTDINLETSRLEYATGMENVARYLAQYATFVLCGYTISAGATDDVYADAYLIPAISDALTNMSDLDNVLTGVNLRQELGTLTVSTTTNELGIWDSSYHANLYTLKKCGDLIGERIIEVISP